ncbi:MAG TPA: DUF1553 domain-containing protein [Planctomycetota bacterium]|nr:DUF1553 domain-containing protein [Planctomycetota bacterium]
MHLLTTSGLALFLLGLALSAQDPKPDPLAVLFETKVRPILVNRCEECHAEDADGGLRLDSREALMKGGDSGAAIMIGDADASLLIQAIRHSHPKLKMPQKRSKLPDDEIAALEEWVKSGAYWPDEKPAASSGAAKQRLAEQRSFWSLQPLSKPAPPSVKNAGWAISDIDRFVLARQEREGLSPVAPATRVALIRRASLDLTGLPPTPEEVAAFVADESPAAFAKVVDRLLASPQYGEAWGRWWLDVARYGEDDCRSLDPMGRGYNPYPNAYLYRDWVVQAFNDDMPYDTFVKAQLAADQHDEKARVALLPGLGFLGLGPWLYDNGSVEVTRADERHDRVDAVSRGFLGLTIACARCHDHKYDAVPTEDYYALAGVFRNTTYHEYPRVPQSVVDEFKTADKRIENKAKLLREFQKTESRQLAQTLALQSARYMKAAWRVLGEPKKDKALVASEEKLDYELFDRWLAFLVKPPKHYKYLEKWQAMIAARGKKDEAAKIADEFQEQLLDIMFEHIEVEEENDVIRAKAQPETKKKKKANLPDEFLTNDDFCPGCGLELKGLPGEKNSLWVDMFDHDLDSEVDIAQGDFDSAKPGVFSFSGFGLERQLGADRRRYLEELRADIKKLRKDLPPKFPYVHGVIDVAAPTPIKVHQRGSPFRLGAEVPSHFPALLCADQPIGFTKGSGRLELADAIVAHPITMRVIANRIWKGHFGTGIVDTPSDFGLSGERPMNPELLEHLASLFVEGGMSLKKLHRAILLSATYQLSDANSEVDFAKDSGNRLYWRANDRRLTAEQIRDSALFAAGALELKMGGPSEKLTPYKVRRTIYGQVSRYKPDEFLALFDFPAPNASSERRFTTHVPLQRLFLMNSDFMQQCAELLAKRVETEADDKAKIQKLYSLLFARAADDDEVRAGLAYLAAEPMKEFEERKAARLKEELEAKDKPKSKPEKPDKKSDEMGEDEADSPDKESDAQPGMMAGVQGADPAAKPAQKPLPVTILGRYAKVLLSSHEFLFVR